jgi:hypothetical protein
MKENVVRYALTTTALAVASMFWSVQPSSAAKNFSFDMSRNAGLPTGCVAAATGHVTISSPRGGNQTMHVEVSGLPKNTGFDLFVLQVPTSPFGMSWYQGDIETDDDGTGVADFVGIFSIETFTVAPGVARAPNVFDDDARKNPATAPIQLYHLGLWFNSPQDAANAGCPNTVTPFNGEHNAGVQVLNTSSFRDTRGPLFHVK